jgi:hypothetical protein
MASGHAVRGTTRGEARLDAIARTGAEAVSADPYRLATLLPQVANISAVCWLLGSATGDEVTALHTTRLETMLERLVDTMVRGMVYEAAGTVDAALLRGGAELVRSASERWHMPTAVAAADPRDHEAWLAAMCAAVEGVLAA